MIFFRKALIALVLICVFTLPFYSSPYIRMLFAIVFIVVFLGDVLRKRTLRFTWQELFLSLIPFLVIAHAAFGAAYIKSSLSYEVLYYGLPCIMLLSIRRIWRTNYDWLWLAYSYLAGCIVAAITLIVSWVTSNGAIYGRITVGELNANYVSYSLATGVTVALILVLLTNSKVKTNFLIGVILALSFAILLSGTRGSIISVVILLAMHYLFQLSHQPLKVFWTLFLSIIIATFLLSIIPERVYTRILSDGSTADVSSGRYDLWSLAVSFISEKPLLGNGLHYFESQSFNEVKIHNVFLTLLVEFGIVGFILYTSVMFSFVFMKSENINIKRARILFIVSWLPIAMTGVWEFSIAPWFVYAWLSRTPKN